MKIEELTDDAIDFILGNIELTFLTCWEQGFVCSIEDQWERNRSLSDRQKETLSKIWERQP